MLDVQLPQMKSDKLKAKLVDETVQSFGDLCVTVWWVAMISLTLMTSAFGADKPVTLEQLFAPLQTGGCVPLDKIRKIAPVSVLDERQYDFVRGFWMGIPPQSDSLPPGDSAFLTSGGGNDNDDAVGTFDSSDGEVCAVVHAPTWLRKVLDAVSKGEAGKRGRPT
jgi:hypothetical protein